MTDLTQWIEPVRVPCAKYEYDAKKGCTHIQRSGGGQCGYILMQCGSQDYFVQIKEMKKQTKGGQY